MQHTKKYLIQLHLQYILGHLPLTVIKSVAIGLYDTLEDAYRHGNATLENIEKRYNLSPIFNAQERLGNDTGAFGSEKHSVSSEHYNKPPFKFDLCLTTLAFDDVSEILTELDTLTGIKQLLVKG